MAGSIDPAETIDAIIAILGSDLADKFDVLDALYDDGITLADIADYRRAPQGGYDAFPVIVIVADFSGAHEQYMDGGFKTHALQLSVLMTGIVAVGSLLPQEVLAKTLSRTVRGIEEVLRAKDSLTISGTDYAETLRVGNIDYSDFAVGEVEPNAFFRGATMMLDVDILDQS